jgi:hypothetical protein
MWRFLHRLPIGEWWAGRIDLSQGSAASLFNYLVGDGSQIRRHAKAELSTTLFGGEPAAAAAIRARVARPVYPDRLQDDRTVMTVGSGPRVQMGHPTSRLH